MIVLAALALLLSPQAADSIPKYDTLSVSSRALGEVVSEELALRFENIFARRVAMKQDFGAVSSVRCNPGHDDILLPKHHHPASWRLQRNYWLEMRCVREGYTTLPDVT